MFISLMLSEEHISPLTTLQRMRKRCYTIQCAAFGEEFGKIVWRPASLGDVFFKLNAPARSIRAC